MAHRAGGLAVERRLCLGIAPLWARRLERAERARKVRVEAEYLESPIPKEESFSEGLSAAGTFFALAIGGPILLAALLFAVCWLGTKFSALAPLGSYVSAHFTLCWFIALFFVGSLLGDVVDRWQTRKHWRMAARRNKAA